MAEFARRISKPPARTSPSYSYPGAKHGFTNPDATELGKKFGLDIAYDAAADKNSWAALKEFLSAAFTAKQP